MSNYRPISILNNFSKLFALIIHDHVLHYAKFNQNQHGFTWTKSTVTSLVTFSTFLSPVVHVQCHADAIHPDLYNAFDLVPHNILLHTLGSFRFSYAYVSRFHNYLTNRRSRVRISGTLSQPFRVISGVPQRCVLGLFLLDLFIKDLCLSVLCCKLLIFADDLKMFHVI
jgi:hypothetical protein